METPLGIGTLIVVMGLATFFTRVFPFCFLSKFKDGKIVNEIGKILPLMALPLLVIYCLKSEDFSSSSFFGISILLSLMLTTLLQWKFKKPLLSIFMGTFVYCIFVNLIL